MYRLERIRKHTLPLFAIFGLLCITACGLKVWPQPQADEDTFAWGDITFVSRGTCLEINGMLTGAYENLAKIELEIAYTEADCRKFPERMVPSTSPIVSCLLLPHSGGV